MYPTLPTTGVMLLTEGAVGPMDETELLLIEDDEPSVKVGAKVSATLSTASRFLRRVPPEAGPSVHSNSRCDTLIGSQAVPPMESVLSRRVGLKPAPLMVTVLTILRLILEGVMVLISSA